MRSRLARGLLWHVPDGRVEHAILVDLFQSFPEMIVPLLRATGRMDSSRRDAAVDRNERAAEEDTADLRQRTRCPVTLVVVTPSEHVARWAAQPIPLGGGNFYRPVVIGPSRIPRITDLGQAQDMPALSVLSAVVHGRKRGAEEIVRAVLAAACPALDSEQAKVYAHYLGTLPSAGRQRAPEVLGEQRGRAEALRQLVIELLTERFDALPETALARIGEADGDQLAHWGRRVLSAASLDQVLDSTP